MITTPSINSVASEDTVLDVVTTALSEVGLPVPTFVVNNTDQLVQQTLALLKSCGKELYRAYPWGLLNKEWVWTSITNEDEYALPTDWGYFLDQTQWDRTNHWPLLGPKTPQEWQWLKGGLISQGPRTRYRIRNGFFQVHPIPGTPTQQIAMEYISNCWVADSTNTTAKNDISADTDKFYLDPLLLVKFLKYKIKQAKGFDTTALLPEFTTYYSELVGGDQSAPVLNLAPNARAILIGPNNIPDGSWQIGP